ncbi:hypothetical protein [Pseudomonas sp.]|uniref:hypothetical protein n=1 Tax=Pseudomonas sp. TaxID=306 RepID=UPI00290E4404|nr:hypothetical protein [Pseudomonas sp.]MDU4254437.1 hypothetical protein [Pseudomonas sp.]
MAIFVSNMDQFDELVASNSKSTILLAGETVYMTNDKRALDSLQEEAGERYVLQPPRIASRGRLLDSKKEYLYVAVAKQAAEYAQSFRGTVALAADHYLAYGLSQKRDCIIIGGGKTQHDELNLEFFVFSNHRLVETVERTSSSNSFMLETAVHEVADRYKGFDIHWCDPLGEPPMFDLSRADNFQYVGDIPVRNLIKRKLYAKSQKVEEPWGLFTALLIACAGAGAFIASSGFQWIELNSARKAYHQEVAGYEAAYSNSAQSLDLLRQRDFLMTSPSESIERIKMVNSLLTNAASIDGVVIHSVKVFSADDADATSTAQSSTPGAMAAARDDFRLEFSVPQSAGAGARDQAEPIVAMLNHLTGMTIRVIDHNAEKVKLGEQEVSYWRYKLGGGRNAQ